MREIKKARNKYAIRVIIFYFKYTILVFKFALRSVAFKMPHNGYMYETLGIARSFSVSSYAKAEAGYKPLNNLLNR